MLYFLRHTKVFNPQGLCYGQSDLPLDKSFDKEVNNIKNELSLINFSHIYSSPLERCKRLSNYLIRNNIKPIFDKRLMEMNFGRWEGIPWNDIYNDEYGKIWFSSYDTLRCPEGESFTDMLKRVSEFLHTLPSDNEDILIITHAGVIRSVKVLVENISIRESFNIGIGYGEIYKIEKQ